MTRTGATPRARVLYQRFGTLAAPLDTKTGTASHVFTTPAPQTSLLIPAGVITPHSRVTVFADIRRSTAVATATVAARLGTAGTTADSSIFQKSMAATVDFGTQIAQSARFGTSTTSFYTLLNTQQNTDGANGNDRTINVNTAADMWITFTVTGADTGDSFSLPGYSVWLEN